MGDISDIVPPTGFLSSLAIFIINLVSLLKPGIITCHTTGPKSISMGNYARSSRCIPLLLFSFITQEIPGYMTVNRLLRMEVFHHSWWQDIFIWRELELLKATSFSFKRISGINQEPSCAPGLCEHWPVQEQGGMGWWVKLLLLSLEFPGDLWWSRQVGLPGM